MLFRFRYIVRHFGMNQTPDALEIEKTDPPIIRMSIQKLREDEAKQFPANSDYWSAEVLTEESVSAKVQAQFESNANHSTPAMKEISTRVSERIRIFLVEFLRIARWRTGVYGHHRLIHSTDGKPQWSIDAEAWKFFPGVTVAIADSYAGAIKYEPELFHEMKQMLLSHDHEPLGHELLREAWNLRHSSPRGALILSVSALEVGVKAFIGTLVPPAEWLCFEMQTPPVVKMLTEYLPLLPVKLKIDGKVFIPETIIETVKKAITLRNHIVHRGRQVEISNSLNEIFTSIQMALYFMDYYSGHAWSISKMRDPRVNDLLREAFDGARKKKK